MKDFKYTIAKQTVHYNSDKPDTQVVTKEDIEINTYYLWGLIKITDIKDITQKYGENKGIGFTSNKQTNDV